MMYRLGVSQEFSAAHFLDGYQGSCEAVHGHNYRVEATIEVDCLDNVGMGVDFRELKKSLREILETLDHQLLNESSYFKKRNPSSENIARYIYEMLETSLMQGPARLTEVTVWETSNAWASFSRGKTSGEPGQMQRT